MTSPDTRLAETHIRVPSIRYKRRWFCYLDLLGFSQLVRSHSIDLILPSYELALRHMEKAAAKQKPQGLSYSWFSDTFIIFSQHDSGQDFAIVEQAGRLFFQHLILAGIPVRGALSCGELYSQLERNVFIGEALIDAHHYGEGQDWLGFVLTPSALSQMEELGCRAQERPFYRRVPSKGVLKEGRRGPVYAFAFNNAEVNRKNPYLEALVAMRSAASAEVTGKYDRTICFLEAHRSENPR